MSEVVLLIAIAVGLLSIIWAIALLVAVWRIREALVDEDFPAVDMMAGGADYRVKVSRVRGRFGAVYQRKDGQPVTVEPRFRDRGAVMVHIRKILTTS